MKIAGFLLLLLLLPSAVWAREGQDRVKLKNGEVIQGAVLYWSGGNLNFDSDEKGWMTINSSDIEEVHLGPRPRRVVSSPSPAPEK